MRTVKLLIGLLLLTACTKVPPGWVGIVVNQWGSQRGVEDFPIKTGRVTYNPFTMDVYQFPTFMQVVTWTAARTEGSPDDDSMTFNSIEGAVINADISLAYSFEEAKVPNLFVTFRKSPEELMHTYVRNELRDVINRIASNMAVTDIYGAGKQRLLNEAMTSMMAKLGPVGFKIDMVSFVGALRVDSLVASSINAVIIANQKAIEAQNKIVQSRAEAEQQVAEARGDSASSVIRATGEAEANRRIAQSLSGGILDYISLNKWNGILPTVTGGSIPMISIPNR